MFLVEIEPILSKVSVSAGEFACLGEKPICLHCRPPTPM